MNAELVPDTSDADEFTANLLRSLHSGYREVLEKAADKLAEGFDDQFLLSGDPYPFADLSPATINRRYAQTKAKGIVPVAGYNTPLRVTDTMRRAAIATTEGVPGSAYEIDANQVTVGIDEGELTYARRATGLDSDTIPDRNPIVLLPQREKDITRLFEDDLRRRIAQADR